jgi:hypothetical protein
MEEGMIKKFEKEIAYLKSIGADKLPHSNRSLLDHLIGTTEYLILYNRSIDEQKAGLFHSIYGTAYYKHSEKLSIERSEIKELIGNKAELIANIFCNTKDRTNYIISGEWFMEPWLTKLRWLEFANLLEQRNELKGTENIEKLGILLNVGKSNRRIHERKRG